MGLIGGGVTISSLVFLLVMIAHKKAKEEQHKILGETSDFFQTN